MLGLQRTWSQDTDRADLEGNKNVSTVLGPRALAHSKYSINIYCPTKKRRFKRNFMEHDRYNVNQRGDGVSVKTLGFSALYATEIQTELKN